MKLLKILILLILAVIGIYFLVTEGADIVVKDWYQEDYEASLSVETKKLENLQLALEMEKFDNGGVFPTAASFETLTLNYLSIADLEISNNPSYKWLDNTNDDSLFCAYYEIPDYKNRPQCVEMPCNFYVISDESKGFQVNKPTLENCSFVSQ